MINTQLKFEAKIPNGAKVCRIHKEITQNFEVTGSI